MGASPETTISALLDRALRAYAGAIADQHGRGLAPAEARKLPEVTELMKLPEDASGLAVVLLTERMATEGFGSTSTGPELPSVPLLDLLVRRRPELDAEQAERLLSAGIDADRRWKHSALYLVEPSIKLLERSSTTWTDAERASLSSLLTRAAPLISRGAGSRLNALGPRAEDDLPTHLLNQKEDVGSRLVARLREADEPLAAVATAMELFGGLPASGKPSATWLASAATVATGLRDPTALVAGQLTGLLEARDSARDDWVFFISDPNERFALGVLRFAATLQAPELLDPLRRVAQRMIVVVGGQFGVPRSIKLANAATVAIADAALPGSIGELLALERAVRHGSLLAQIRKSVNALAAAQGMTRDELLEQAVERHDLDPDGFRSVALPTGGSARLEVGARSASLLFVDDDGVPKKAFPAAAKEQDDALLAALREELKSIRKTLAGERHRIDGLLASARSWPIDAWQRYYLDHPITGRLTRDLIWRFLDAAGEELAVGRPQDEKQVLQDDGTLADFPGATSVALWHPVLATPMEVGAWRQHCVDHRLVQPVKQAFREIYVITPAERETQTYSNRFAGHIFRQSQARALMKGRGWSTQPLAWWDDGRDYAIARRTFEHAGLRAEFNYAPLAEIEPESSDLYPLCTSDQLRFSAVDSDDGLPLDELPALAFSEALRDVDLFIGVTSIGADPEWEDGGDGPIAARLGAYWSSMAFGELTASAKIRHEILAGLIPSLAIASQCELEDRFLVVRGTKRTYRIHLGSGNILMEPNGEYLCIVTAPKGATSKLFLPMDDDPVLTVILSKAFLLAADEKIADETILAQIRRSWLG